MPLTRRRFSGAALLGLTRKSGRAIPGGFADRSHEAGHRLRDGATAPAPRDRRRIPAVIVGGGIAGLSAAWRFQKRGFRDFVVLEMEAQAGGNARWGENEITGFPWAAHYVPLPGPGAPLVREMMADLGVLRGGEWEERYLCHSPQERLYLHGRWQEGLEPDVGATNADRDQYRRFHEKMEEFSRSGEFRIPMETGARRQTGLDRLPMREWLREQRFDSPYLLWLVDYACRDDYGARAADTSAWAGIHYFAARSRESERGPLTWPEGNGWIVRRLMDRLGGAVRTGAFVHRIMRAGSRWRVWTAQQEYEAEAVVFAAPTFLARYMMEEAPRWECVYSPWLTANLTLERPPRDRGPAPPSWDNVIFKSPALGYVVATHQSLRSHVDRSVWTYYWALADGPPAANRRRLLETPWETWKEAILDDLAQAHPDIRDCVSRIDIMRLGHAMPRPTPGFLSRRRPQSGSLFWANSDQSGIPLFEEAQYRGAGAADAALRLLGKA